MTESAYIITDNAVTLFHNNDVHTLHSDATNFDLVKTLIGEGHYEQAVDEMKPARPLARFFASSRFGDVTFDGEAVYYEGDRVHEHITERAVHMCRNGAPLQPLLNLIERIYANGSFRARTELFGFLERGELPITPDGYFLAYKRVTDDYLDVYTRSIDNSIGKEVHMDRGAVDDNPNNTCSSGLHFCSLEYLASFSGSRIMVLKIDPVDVVSIPVDYNSTKGRCCGYTVVGELPPERVAEIDTKWRNAVVWDYEPVEEEEQLEEVESCNDPDCWCSEFAPKNEFLPDWRY